jgi:mannose-6-phosphate isomerase-like protein (cupin superfamily)
MMRALCFAASILLLGTAADANEPALHRSFVQAEKDIAVEQPGPHEGAGRTTAFPFFEAEPGLGFVFRKRILHPGSSIGAHRNDKDEIYYVLDGRGELMLQDETREVGPGDAVLTRDGHSHGLRTLGDEDLVILVVYPRPAPAPAQP